MGYTFVVQLIVDGIYLALSAHEEAKRGGVPQTWADKEDFDSVEGTRVSTNPSAIVLP